MDPKTEIVIPGLNVEQDYTLAGPSRRPPERDPNPNYEPTPARPAAKGFVKTLATMMASKIGMSLLCTAIVSTVFNSASIWGVVRAICAVIGLLGDEKVTKSVTTLFEKGEQVVKPAPVEGKPSLKERITQAASEPAKKIEGAVVTPIKGAVEEGKQEVKEVGDKVTGAADKVAEKLGGKVDVIQEKRAAAKLEAEKIEAEKLKAHAAQLGLKVEDDWPIERLRSEVREAEVAAKKEQNQAYLEWWVRTGPNGSCPQCHTPMRVGTRSTGRVGCPNARCGANSSAPMVRRQGAPPPPRAYPPAFLIYWNKKKAENTKAAGK